MIVRPRDGADALAIAIHLVESHTLAALVFDGTVDFASADPALVAGSLERLATVVTQSQTAVIFLTERASASPKPGAESQTLAHVATVRLALRR